MKDLIIKKNSENRIEIIDALRGVSILLMVIHHFLFDAVEILGAPEWLFYNEVFDVLQKFFAGVFVVLSGISSNFSLSNIKRGIFTLVVALFVTVVTVLVDMPILFGILHLLGVCMLFYGLTQKLWSKLPQWVLIAAFSLLAVVSVYVLKTVDVKSEMMWIFGWKSSSFVSYDYFPLFPWFFIFMSGTAIGYYIKENKFPKWFYTAKISFLPSVGRCTMLIYIVHQPIIYGLTMLLKSVIK